MSKYPGSFPMAEATNVFTILTSKKVAEKKVEFFEDAWWLQGYLQSVTIKDDAPTPGPTPVFSSAEPTQEDAVLLDVQSELALLPECVGMARSEGFAAAGKPDLQFIISLLMRVLPILLAA